MRMQRSGAILATGALAVAGVLAIGGQASAGTDLQQPHHVVAATLVAPSVVAPSVHQEIFAGYYFTLSACQSEGQYAVNHYGWDSYECLPTSRLDGKNWGLWGFIS